MKKFLHTSEHIHESLFSDNVLIAGFYSWHLAFNSYPGWSGEFQYLKSCFGKLKNYDIIYACVAKPELEGRIFDFIRNEIGYNSKTIVVGAIDYALEIWDMPFNVMQVKDQLSKCDFVFASEPALQSGLRALMNDKEIKLVPHPTNVDFLKTMRRPYNQRQFNIVSMIHRYDNNWKTQFITLLRTIEQKQKGQEMPDIEAILLSGDQNSRIELLPFFGTVQLGAPYPQQMEYLSRQLLCVDSYHRLHTYGRTVADCAAIGLPLVGTYLQYLQDKLFPLLTTKPYDLYAQQDLIERLIKDKEFYQEIINYGYAHVEEFNFKNSVDRFLKNCNITE